MKKNFFKSLLIAGALLFAWNCTEEPAGPGTPEYIVTAPAWLFSFDTDYIIYLDGTVTDADGNIIGSIVFYEGSYVGVLRNLNGEVIIDGLDLNTLPTLSPNKQVYAIVGSVWLFNDGTTEYLIYPTADGQYSVVTDVEGRQIGIFDFTTGQILAADGSGNVLAVVSDIGSLPVLQPGDKFTKEPVSSSSEPVSSSNILIVSSSSIAASSSNVEKPSSSSVKSSSSAKSSSSVQSSSSKPTGGCPTIKTKGGSKGSGWATRYWDCCKPHCSWPEHAHGNYAKQCTNKGKSESTDWGGGSVCSGGGLMTCTSQIPFTVDGCDDYGFAFAAVPASNGGDCGKCFQLTFTGEGHYNSTNANTKAIKGKKLIIMTTNIGGDVQQGQFDIMIPGGGVGQFNGCSSMGWGDQGEQYGGLLSKCEVESNYQASAMQRCLQKKCESVFSNDAEAKKGCLFLAEWMHAAGNPEHNYEEVECPDVLKQRY